MIRKILKYFGYVKQEKIPQIKDCSVLRFTSWSGRKRKFEGVSNVELSK